MNIHALRCETEKRLQGIADASRPALMDRRLNSLIRWGGAQTRFPAVMAHMSETLWQLGTAVPDVIAELAEDSAMAPESSVLVFTALTVALLQDDEGVFVPLLLEAYATCPNPVEDMLAGVTTACSMLRVVLGGWLPHPAAA